MGAPTAIKNKEQPPKPSEPSADDEEMLVDTTSVPQQQQMEQDEEDEQPQESSAPEAVVVDENGMPKFAPASKIKMKVKLESRKVPIPPHRQTPLKNCWPKIYPPIVDHLKLNVRYNVRNRNVELKTGPQTTDEGALQKGADFVRAFTYGFDVDDAIALLRLDDLYIETFEIKDVKTLHGDHLARAIGRIAGKDGKTKFAIENATRTRIVLADSKIHILGGFTHIRMAREAVVSLILGAPPGKVYGNMRTVAARLKERY
ncbi:pre-rRNA-processing protein Pno1p [Diutina catenulata]